LLYLAPGTVAADHPGRGPVVRHIGVGLRHATISPPPGSRPSLAIASSTSAGRVHDDPSALVHQASAAAPIAGRLRPSDLPGARRLDVVWTRCLRRAPAFSFLRPPGTAMMETRRRTNSFASAGSRSI